MRYPAAAEQPGGFVPGHAAQRKNGVGGDADSVSHNAHILKLLSGYVVPKRNDVGAPDDAPDKPPVDFFTHRTNPVGVDHDLLFKEFGGPDDHDGNKKNVWKWCPAELPRPDTSAAASARLDDNKNLKG
jgi:hypothetical protein